MNFHLNHNPAPSLVKISHKDKIMMMGSCFTENIGAKLTANKFNCLINPNGILFNPASIATALHSYMHPENYKYKPGFNNGLHFSFDHHGSYSSSNKDELEKKITRSLSEAHTFLKEATILIITFGSAFIYRRIEDGSTVANCHKLPRQNFMKSMMYPDEINLIYSELINELRDFNPELKIIFTVSPVKYLRDGLSANTISKASLIMAVYNKVAATSNLKSTLLNYFPAYELVTDDLRDYRFYKEDMAHPNEQAIDYVWEKFAATYFDADTTMMNEKISEITKAATHRPIHGNSEAHSKFKTTYLKKCQALEKEIPGIDLNKEKEIFT